MTIRTRSIGESWLIMLSIFLFVVFTVNGLDPKRKLDEATSPGSGEVKCGSCPVPPPPPPVLCPPPPPVVKPPPSPKKPPSPYCPPPPPSYIYITGPPGDLYPIDESNRSQRTGSMCFFPALLGCALLGLFMVA